MDTTVYRRIVDEAIRLGVPEFYILGGEPGLREDILVIIEEAVRKFKSVILVTNGDFLADAGLCARLAETGVELMVQRHSVRDTPAIRDMEKLMMGGDHFDISQAAWANIGRFFPVNRVCVQCCIIKPVVQNGSIFDLFRWIRQKGYEPVMEFTKEGRGFKRGCILDVSPTEMMRVMREFQRIDREEFGLSGVEPLSPKAYGKTCHLQQDAIHFKVDGLAVPCVGFSGLSYGNITNMNLEQILAHPLRAQIADYKNWIYGYCRSECAYFDVCKAGCRGSAFDIAGCYRASFYYCPHIPRDRLKLADMIPPSCDGCPLKGHTTCRPNRG
jgi:radical SAM protein with 4Fe4S-binding SPASM domain